MAAPKKKPVGRPKKKTEVEKAREDTERELEEQRVKEGAPVVGPQKDSAPPQIRFFNATNLKFIDINHEVLRQYLYPNGANITINFPLKLSIDIKGIHRVFDSTGLSYFIPPSWIAVVTKPKPGAPDFII